MSSSIFWHRSILGEKAAHRRYCNADVKKYGPIEDRSVLVMSRWRSAFAFLSQAEALVMDVLRGRSDLVKMLVSMVPAEEERT